MVVAVPLNGEKGETASLIADDLDKSASSHKGHKAKAAPKAHHAPIVHHVAPKAPKAPKEPKAPKAPKVAKAAKEAAVAKPEAEPKTKAISKTKALWDFKNFKIGEWFSHTKYLTVKELKPEEAIIED